ncbi:MAG: hypothetical protein ACT4QD_01925, partial [Acidobacteriota bacterium]
MHRRSQPRRTLLASALIGALALGVAAQDTPIPTARLVPASRLVMPGAVDSNVPLTWDLAEGRWTLRGLTSWGGIPALILGDDLHQMRPAEAAVQITPHPGHGVWIESVVRDDAGTWYGYYHHEVPADACGRPERQIPRIGAAKSTDRGQTWEDLGTILESSPDDLACGSSNRFVVGGVGDVSAMLAPDATHLYLFVSQYARHRSAQGVAVARLAWANRDAPQGAVSLWQDGAWIPASRIGDDVAETAVRWSYPAGTPLVTVTQPWHDGQAAADAFWGPSVHWNTHLEQYVMLVNRAKNENFDNEGIYV